MSKSIEQIVRERDARVAAEKAQRDKEIKKLADAARAKDAEKEQEQKKSEEAATAGRHKNFDDELEGDARSLFFAGNPGASEDVYQSVREDLRRQVLLRRSEESSRHRHSIYTYR